LYPQTPSVLSNGLEAGEPLADHRELGARVVVYPIELADSWAADKRGAGG
jgi:hypothetical protein